MLVIALPARFPLRLLIALLLGALHAASFIDDATWPIEIAALAGLVALSVRAAREIDGVKGLRRALFGGARLGFAFGLGWFLTGVSWIYISLHTYGEMNPLVAGGAILLFCGYLAIYPALACAGFAAFRHLRPIDPRRTSALPHLASVFVFAALWAFAEVARGYVFTGFPWLASGYAHVAGPLRGYAPVIGVYGVSMVAAAVAAALALAGGGRGKRSVSSASQSRLALMLAVVIGLPVIGGMLEPIEWTRPSGAPISVRLLQGNVSQDIKFDQARFDSIADDYLKAVESKRADLIVLPETAFPTFLSYMPEGLVQRIARDAEKLHAEIAFGIPIDEGQLRYFNSVIAISPGAKSEQPADAPPSLKTEDDSPRASNADDALSRVATQRYDKSHLVPFGEFIPLGFHWFVELMNMPLGDFTRGAITQKPMKLAGIRVAFNVCYEDLFGEEIIRQAADANVLINVSNVAWFGNSMALPQHLDISRMRSIETGRPMLRATNTGMTASIDPHGRVLAVLPQLTQGSLDVDVQGTTGLTPFTRLGNAAVMILIVLAIAAALFFTRGLHRSLVRIDEDGEGRGFIEMQ
jgi:apolipoprotein N-acyltransferase